MRKPKIATLSEVCVVLTSIMRGEMTEETVKRTAAGEERTETGPRISERCRAAELLAKHLSPQPEDNDTTRQVIALLQAMKEEHETGGG